MTKSHKQLNWLILNKFKKSSKCVSGGVEEANQHENIGVQVQNPPI